MTGVLDDLGQLIVPDVFNSLQNVGLVDRMNITHLRVSQTATGGIVKEGSPMVYGNVNVSYEPLSGRRIEIGGKPLSSLGYKLTFPTHQDGIRIDLDVKNHRLEVIERGNEPSKTFRIIAVKDVSGVIFECICEREN